MRELANLDAPTGGTDETIISCLADPPVPKNRAGTAICRLFCLSDGLTRLPHPANFAAGLGSTKS
jgi:hypothetical protein